MTALSKSKPVVSMARLAQLLEERQEPFKLEVYLSERRYTKKSFDRIGSRKVKWRIAIPNGSKILKSAINKLVSYKNCQKSVHCKDRGIPAFGRGNKQQHNAVRNFISLGFPLPCQSTFQASKLHNLRDLEVATNTKDSKQLSPVSVLEELPSNEGKKEEIKPISGFNFPRKAKSTYLCEFLLQSLTEKHNCVSETELQDVKSSSDQHLKPKQVSMQTKQLLFNCVTEAMDTYGKQGRRQRSGREGLPEEFGKVICEQLSSLEEQYGDVKYINQLIDLNGTTEEWRNFQRWNKEIGKVIANAVLDDIITETINFEVYDN